MTGMDVSDSPGNFNGPSGRDLVLDAADIAEVVGQSVKLKRAGREFVGLCPFHSEKTPSFHVIPHKRFYHCFGCKKSGNAIDFVMERDRIEFVDALKLLAEQFNVELPKRRHDPQEDRRRQVMDALSAAAMHFARNLRRPEGKACVEYLKSRGFTGETARDFQLGYSSGRLLEDPAMKPFGRDVLVEADLLRQAEGRAYESFRDRLMFPIRDDRGRCIAFGGRVLPGSDHPAKYLNSKETGVFHKSDVAYGLDRAKDAITRSRTVAVVEGYTDVVMAHQHGARNVVSVLGTALTPGHVKLLRRFADRVVLLFDADTAGAGATERSIELFLTQPVEIGIATLPDGQDPDEFVVSSGAEAFAEVLAGAMTPLEYHWRQVTRQAGDSLTGRERAIGGFLELIAKAKAAGNVPVERWGPAMMQVARSTGLKPADIERRIEELGNAAPRQAAPPPTPPPRPEKRRWLSPEEFRRQRQRDRNKRPPAVTDQPKASADQTCERLVLGGLLVRPEAFPAVQKLISPDDFVLAETAALAERYWDHQRNEGEVELMDWQRTIDDDRLRGLVGDLAIEAERLDDLEGRMAEAVQFVQARRQRRQGEQAIRQQLGRDADADAEALRRLAEQAARRSGG